MVRSLLQQTRKNATPYVELTLANSSAGKIYIAVADLVNEHKAGAGIEITNNSDGTRTIEVSQTLRNNIDHSVTDFRVVKPGEGESYYSIEAVRNNNGTTTMLMTDESLSLGIAGGSNNPMIGLSSDISDKINGADTLSKTNKTNLDALTTRVDGIVATGGEANQNAYSNIKVGSTTLAASAKTDTVAFSGGTNIHVAASTADGNKSVSFSHATPTGAAAKTAGFYKFATDATGHATGLTAVAASDITALIGAHSLTLSKTNAENDTAAITIGSTSYTVGPIPLGDQTNPAKDTVRYILNH